jgi:GTPase SAR1 family protein
VLAGRGNAQWIDELRVHGGAKPFLLIGTKIDLRDDPHTCEEMKKLHLSPITADQGRQLAKEIGAEGCVTLTNHRARAHKHTFNITRLHWLSHTGTMSAQP